MLKACSLSLTSAHRGSSATFAPALVPPGRLTILKQQVGVQHSILILNLTATKNAVKLPLLTYFMYYSANHILKTVNFLTFCFLL